ncbi:MAG: hypothetical protein K9W44_10910 [Candidatus Lokiarchaeota archaeon]|nr:hypothetical protein [Candidatus Harpocratesius repetitus]
MTQFSFTQLNQWKISELRDFVKSNNLHATGRSKQEIIKKLQTLLSTKQCEKLVSAYMQKKTSSTKKSFVKKKRTSYNQSLTSNRQIINKINIIENQIRTLFTRINKIEDKLNSVFSESTANLNRNMALEPLLLTLIPRESGITIDNLLDQPELKNISKSLIEQAILDLVDDEKIMVSEGRSKQKIGGYIGRVSRVR